MLIEYVSARNRIYSIYNSYIFCNIDSDIRATSGKVKYKLLSKEADDEDNISNNNNNKSNFEIEEQNSSIVKNKNDPCSNFRTLLFILFFALTIGFSLLVIILNGKNIKNIKDDKYDSTGKNFSSTDWSLNMENFGTESCIRLFDIDEDGKLMS